MRPRHNSAAATLLLTLIAAAVVPLRAQPAATPVSTAAPPDMPTVAREFRGVWVATVGNMDWPSSP
jgi:hypothetical protein